MVYLTPALTELLAGHVGRVQAFSRDLKRVVPWLFPHFAKPYRGTQRRDFRKARKTACTDAGYAGMLRHDFRRTAVRNMVNRPYGQPGRSAGGRAQAGRARLSHFPATVGQVTLISGKRKARAARG